MKNKRTLKEKIIQSVFVYETKKITIDSIIKMAILLLSGGTILILGGVISDMIVESEMAGLIGEFMKEKEYSYSTFRELSSVLVGEIPLWLIVLYTVGLALGCILIVSVIKNRKSISHKICSLVRYWFTL
jgi:hypothetical protein